LDAGGVKFSTAFSRSELERNDLRAKEVVARSKVAGNVNCCRGTRLELRLIPCLSPRLETLLGNLEPLRIGRVIRRAGPITLSHVVHDGASVVWPGCVTTGTTSPLDLELAAWVGTGNIFGELGTRTTVEIWIGGAFDRTV
jgi:hypothetical protein